MPNVGLQLQENTTVLNSLILNTGRIFGCEKTLTSGAFLSFISPPASALSFPIGDRQPAGDITHNGDVGKCSHESNFQILRAIRTDRLGGAVVMQKKRDQSVQAGAHWSKPQRRKKPHPPRGGRRSV